MQDTKTTLKKGDLIRNVSIYSSRDILYIYFGHFKHNDVFGIIGDYMRLLNVKKFKFENHRMGGGPAAPCSPASFWQKIN